jgi:hypothetical protein
MKKILLSVAALTMLFGATLLTSCTKDDTTAPVITLTGGAVTLDLGDTYTDPGFTATDDKDGTLTSSVVTSGTVNTSQVGTYTINYTVSDAAGNTGTASRVVTVRSNKLAGTYKVSSVITGGPGAPGWDGTVTVTQSSTEYNKLLVANFGGWGAAVIGYIVVSGTNITVPSQSPTGVPSGSEGTALGTSGTYSVSGTTIAIATLNYSWTYTSGGPADVCTETWTKQ